MHVPLKHKQQDIKFYDLIGIGGGPANLSLAALLTKAKNLQAVFLEKRTNFEWHPGMLFDTAKLQVPFINDLVTTIWKGANYANILSYKNN